MIPVTLLTGFLGSGKTTVLAHLLRQPAFARTAVVINEFGEVGLDHELVAASDEQFVELTTGCLCCKVQSDLVVTLQDMLARRDAGTLMPFERIVIETTGLADPAPILHALMTTPDLIGRLQHAVVVTTLDAMTGAAALTREPVSRKQLAVADRLIVTKTDLAGGMAPALIREIDGLNASAPRLVAVAGRIDPAALFASEGHVANFAMDTFSAMPEPTHRDGIVAHVMTRATPLHAVALTLFLEALAEHCGADILRLKGLVAIAQAPDRPAVVHGVQHVFHPLTWLEAWPSADRTTRLVIITRKVPATWIDALLAAIEAEVADLEPMR